MEVTNAAAAPESADPTQATQPTVPASESQLAAVEMETALKAFRSAVGAPTPAPEAPGDKPGTSEPAKPETAPAASQAPETAPATKPSDDLTAILARMQRFEDERASSQSRITELEAKLRDADAQLQVKDPIEFLKRKGFTKDQVEDWLLNGDKSQVAQKSELEQLKDRIAKFEAAESERSQQTAAQKAEAQRAAAEQHYKTNTIAKALDATKYPLLHKAHSQEEIVNLAYATAVDHFRRTNGQEPAMSDVLGRMEGALKTLQEKLMAGAPATKAREVAPTLTDLAARSQAGTGGTEPDDDASALAAAAAMAAQFLKG